MLRTIQAASLAHQGQRQLTSKPLLACTARQVQHRHHRMLASSLTALLFLFAAIGYFASKSGQSLCNDCDDGDIYQEESGQTLCKRCPPNTQRYLKVLTASNRSACQCKNGAGYTCGVDGKRKIWIVPTCVLPFGRLLPSGGQGWGGVLRPPSLRSLMLQLLQTPLDVLRLAGVCKMYEAHWSVGLFRRLSGTYAVSLLHRGCGRSSWSKLRWSP